MSQIAVILFEPYAIDRVEVPDLIGDAYYDFIKANKKANYTSTPQGYTWHHVEDGKTMILVPSEIRYNMFRKFI